MDTYSIISFMNLPEYVKTLDRHQARQFRKKLVAALRISKAYARHLCNGRNRLPTKYAIIIEQLTDGAVLRYVTAPDHYPQMDGETSYARICQDITSNMD